MCVQEPVSDQTTAFKPAEKYAAIGLICCKKKTRAIGWNVVVLNVFLISWLTSNVLRSKYAILSVVLPENLI